MLKKVAEFDVDIYCEENPDEDVVEMRNAKKRAWHKPQTKQA